MTVMRPHHPLVIAVMGFVPGLAGAAEPSHQAASERAAGYRCIFNHELLIVSHRKDNSPEYIKSFIAKLEYTDVDAVMCCPQMWRNSKLSSRRELASSYNFCVSYFGRLAKSLQTPLHAVRA